MDRINLAPRLKLLSDLVPPGSRLADLGTDHGWLPIYLLEEGRISYAVATDIRSGPLERAMSHMQERGTADMDCILCDGLAGVQPRSVDCIVIAGMGGDSIVDILSAAPWARLGTRLLLQPMSRPEVLRRGLAELGLHVLEEHLVEDHHRLYPILVCEGGEPDAYRPGEYYTGKASLSRSPDLFRSLKEKIQSQMEKALEGLSRSNAPDRIERSAAIQSILDEFREDEEP